MMRVRWGAVIAALSIIAVAACGDDGGSDELSADEWVEQADAICTDVRERQSEIEAPDSNPQDVTLTDRELEAWGEYFEAILPFGEETVERFADLGTPEEIADQVETINSLRDESVLAVQAAADAAREGDNVAFRTEIDDVVALNDEIDAAYQEVGTQVCGQDGGSDQPSDETVPVDQWTDEVLAICEAQGEALSEIPEPSVPQEEVTEAELPEVATYLRANGDVYTDTVGEVNQVGTPEGEGAASDAADFVDALGGVATAFYDSADVADTGDVEAWNKSTDAITTAFGDAGSIGQDLGVEACVQ